MSKAIKKSQGMSLTVKILIGTAAGIIFGSVVGPWASNLKFLGDVWIRLLQMSVVPLVMTSVILAVGSIDMRIVGRMGLHTCKWVALFTLTACAFGIIMGYVFQPGVGVTIVDPSDIVPPEVSGIADTVLSFFSTNIINSMANGAMVPCMVFSIFFGLAAGIYGSNSGDDSMIKGVKTLNSVIMNIIKMVMNLSPIGIFFLMANVSGAIGFRVIIPMVKFLGAMAIGTIAQFLIFIPLAGTVARVNPFKIPQKVSKVATIALTTTSSQICLPTQMEDSVTKLGVSRRISDFCGPIGCTMNSTGAAMWDVFSVFFMAQASGVQLTVQQITVTVVIAILLSMGNVGIPGGTAMILAFMATSMGLPLDSIALLMSIDWFAGMFRTVLDVVVDMLVALMVAADMKELDRDVFNGVKTVEYVR